MRHCPQHANSRRSLNRWAAAYAACALLGAVWLAGCRAPHRIELTVSVAASLTGTIEQVEADYSRLHPEIVFRNNFGSSGALARQVEQGAPVDLLLSAGAKPVDELVAQGRIHPEEHRVLLTNHLVLIAPAGSSLTSLDQLASGRVRRIALGQPESVPAGLYAVQTLQAAQLKAIVQPKLIEAKDVRQVLAYVESGNVDAGFVYATDARQSARVRVIATIDHRLHDPIVYPIAVIAASPHAAQARAFSQFLFTAQAASVFAQRGFNVAAQP